MIELNNLCLYTRHPILDGVNYNFSDQNIYGIVAINGSGKTTLFRTMVNLRKAQGGQILFDHQSVESVRSEVFYFETTEWLDKNLNGYDYLNFVKKLWNSSVDLSEVIKTWKMQEELKSVKEDIPIFENLLNSTELTEDEILQTKQNLSVAQEREKYLDAKIQAYQSKQWDQFYQSDMALIDLMIDSVHRSPQMYGADLLDILEANQDYSEYMSTTGLGFDSRFAPVQGTSYAIKVFEDFYPIILILLLTYFASFVYCSSRVGSLDFEDLIPKSNLVKQMLRLLVGVIVGMIVLFFLFGLCLLCGLIGSSVGGLQAPILFYTLEGTTKFVSIASLLFKFLVLSILGIMLIVNLVAVFSRWMNKQMTCFFVSLIVVGGLMWCVQEIAPLHSIVVSQLL